MTSVSERTSNKTLWAMCGLEVVALGALLVPIFVGLALKVHGIEKSMSDESALAIVTAFGAASALLANPLFGWISDRVQVSRAVWLVVGVVAGLAVAPLLISATTVVEITVAWVLMQAVYNATFAALYTLVSEAVPVQDRARASGWFTASANGSMLVGLGFVTFLPKTMPVLFLLLPAISVPVAVIAYLHLRGVPRLLEVDKPKLTAVLRASGQYWLVWLQRVFAQTAYMTVGLFGVFYLIRRAGFAPEDAATVVTASIAGSAALGLVAAVVAGRLAVTARSFGPFLVVGLVIVGVALVVKSVTVTAAAFVVATLLAGFGMGIYSAVDFALVLRTVPATNVGAFLGVFNIARTLPQALAPAIGPLLLALGSGDLFGLDRTQNFFALYLAGALIILGALLLIAPMRILRAGASASG